MVLFWSAVVFLYFLIRFRTWAADPPPLEFAHTPPRHCTTRSRYLVAQAAYAGLGAADKAAIQLVKVQSCQLLVTDT